MICLDIPMTQIALIIPIRSSIMGNSLKNAKYYFMKLLILILTIIFFIEILIIRGYLFTYLFIHFPKTVLVVSIPRGICIKWRPKTRVNMWRIFFQKKKKKIQNLPQRERICDKIFQLCKKNSNKNKDNWHKKYFKINK